MFGGSRGGGGSNYSQLPLNDKNGGYYSDSSDESDEDDFIQRQVHSQRQQMKEQDEGLEMLGQSAVRLGELSMNISEELGEQNKILDNMENDLDRASTNLDIVTEKTKELIKKSGGKKNFLIILGLSMVVIVLFLILVS
mmetsp:Transcript_39319/g.39818  ORF Transcript_39319/g.39818 Transcript_39319/m.39818 type:complete len:139 (-) Transcript_39319:141-557(-)